MNHSKEKTNDIMTHQMSRILQTVKMNQMRIEDWFNRLKLLNDRQWKEIS